MLSSGVFGYSNKDYKSNNSKTETLGNEFQLTECMSSKCCCIISDKGWRSSALYLVRLSIVVLQLGCRLRIVRAVNTDAAATCDGTNWIKLLSEIKMLIALLPYSHQLFR